VRLRFFRAPLNQGEPDLQVDKIRAAIIPRIPDPAHRIALISGRHLRGETQPIGIAKIGIGLVLRLNASDEIDV
jgi:hypothetical protein